MQTFIMISLNILCFSIHDVYFDKECYLYVAKEKNTKKDKVITFFLSTPIMFIIFLFLDMFSRYLLVTYKNIISLF